MAKVPEAAVEVLQGQDLLQLYEWNARTAKHFFLPPLRHLRLLSQAVRAGPFPGQWVLPRSFDGTSLPVRATDGASTTLEDPEASPDWQGPRAKALRDASGVGEARGWVAPLTVRLLALRVERADIQAFFPRVCVARD
jgi:hypothetical protein